MVRAQYTVHLQYFGFYLYFRKIFRTLALSVALEILVQEGVYSFSVESAFIMKNVIYD